jgi:7-cyano-7-deazaguanine reductase
MAITKLGQPPSPPTATWKPSTTDPSQRITLDCTEFTCRCPTTGQPDWATIRIDYQPGAVAVETKSLKLYLETFREEGIFHEHLATLICGDITKALDPVSVTVTVVFHARGGIAVTASSSHPPF